MAYHNFEAQMAPEDGVIYYEMCSHDDCDATLAILDGFEVVFTQDNGDIQHHIGVRKTEEAALRLLTRFRTKFVALYHSPKEVMTKVEAIKCVMQDQGGTATLQDIYQKAGRYYKGVKAAVSWQAGLRGVLYREIRDGKTFKKVGEATYSLI